MEGELWAVLYPLVQAEDKRRPRRPRVAYNDAIILSVALWAVLHDRPICWACRSENWGRSLPWLALPVPGTMSTRLRTLSVQLLLEQVFARLLCVTAIGGFCLCRRIDSEAHARRGVQQGPRRTPGVCDGRHVSRVQAVRLLGHEPGHARGGRLRSDERVGPSGGDAPHRSVGPTLRRGHDGRILVDGRDARHQSALHDYAGAHGFQAITPRKQPGAGLGHRDHSPHRLRSIELLEGPADLNEFGRTLYAQRGQVERDFGNAGSFGCGLQPLPNFVRRPRRVVLWAIGKLIINGLRICQKHGLTP